MRMRNKTLIEEGDNVIFRREGSSRIFQIRRKRTVFFSKQKFCVEELIGQPYGSTFELEKGTLSRVQAQAGDAEMGAWSLDQSADNRNLLDSDKNQRMSKEDIMKMKDEGVAGEKIIEELIENSETFKSKTEFSKAKYLKKKKKKHLLVFTVHQPTQRLIMEMYSKEPGKLNFLRADSLSQILCFSNVMYGSRVAVMESSQGLLVASLLQRMGGEGKLIQLIASNQQPPTRNIVDYFSFPKEHLDNLYTFPLNQLSMLDKESLTDPAQPSLEPSSNSEAVCKPTENPSVSADKATESAQPSLESSTKTEVDCISKEDSSVCADKPTDSENVPDTAERMDVENEIENGKDVETVADAAGDNRDSSVQETNNCVEDNTVAEKCASEKAEDSSSKPEQFVKNRELQRIARAKRLAEAAEIIKHKQLDSLVIACKQNPQPILMRMLEHIGPSRAVVVFSQYLDPLVECYTSVKEKHLGIQLKLCDSWLREYQVLPQRTHPKVSMSGTGGYLLTFVTTVPSESV